MDFINKLKGESDKTLEEIKKWITDSGSELVPAFEKLKKTGKNNADGIVQWMKDAKLISSKETEAKVREELDKVPDKKNISFLEFKDTVVGMAQAQARALEEMGAAVKVKGTKMAAALRAGTSAFVEALGNASEGSEEHEEK